MNAVIFLRKNTLNISNLILSNTDRRQYEQHISATCSAFQFFAYRSFLDYNVAGTGSEIILL